MVKPEFSTEEINQFLQTNGITPTALKELPSYIDQNFCFKTADNEFVLKIANAGETRAQLEMENKLMRYLNNRSELINVPQILTIAGQEIAEVSRGGLTYFVRKVTYLRGTLLSDLCSTVDPWLFGRFIGELQKHVRDFDHPNLDRYLRWDILRSQEIIEDNLQFVMDKDVRAQILRFKNVFAAHLSIIKQLPRSAVHNDTNDNNVLFDNTGDTFGLIDFGDTIRSLRIAELVIGAAYFILDKEHPIEIIQTIIAGYYSVVDIWNREVKYLLLLIAMRYCVSICISSRDIIEDPDNEYILISQQSVLEMLDYLNQLSDVEILDFMDLSFLLEQDDTEIFTQHDELMKKRDSMTSRTLSLAYHDPLTIRRGRMQYLYDENQLAYLDMVNNVPIIGHSNPVVVNAMTQQGTVLNTNTRYLHPSRFEYFSTLKQTLPERFTHIFFVNSGTEANELAIRLAKNHTASSRFVVLEDAYHGNSNAVVDISPYKFLGKGGKGKPDHVSIIPRADTVRGLYTGVDAVNNYLRDAKHIISSIDGQISALFIEPVMGVAGQFFPPSRYLQEVCDTVKGRGALCIADEVQVGFGRLGSHFWGFQLQGLDEYVDIITLGKPMGNGFPIGAVVTTSKIADSFVTGMEYFNTFGGNPLSVRVAHAVLNYILDNDLQQHSYDLGQYFVGKLQDLQSKYPFLSDIRGSGLFLGVELLDEHQSPMTSFADNVIEEMKRHHILLSTDGPDHNVLKIKPPLVITKQDIDHFIDKLDKILASL